MKILFLGDLQHPNSQNWVNALTKYGNCEVETWSLPWPTGFIGKVKRILTFMIGPILINQRIKGFKPDIVIGYRITSYGFLAALSGHNNIVIASQAESDVYPSHVKNSLLHLVVKKYMAKIAIYKAKLIHAWAEHMAISIYELGSPRSKVLILHRGVDFDNFNVDSEKEKNALNIIVTRALYKEYKHEVIINSLVMLKAKNIPFKLKIIGSGIEESSLKKLVNELNLQNEITFYGKLNNLQIIEHFKNCNVYTSMPITEGVSASLVEAMACYCIPVVSDLAANRLFIEHNKNGFLIPINNSLKLAETFEHIWQNINSYEAMIKNNRILVENYSSQKTNIGIFIKEYNKILSK